MHNLAQSLISKKGPIFIGLFLWLVSLVSYAQLNTVTPSIFTQFETDAYQGNPDARFVFIEYADYQCPYCQKMHQSLNKWFAKQSNESINVKWVYRQFPILGSHSILQSQTAICVLETLGQIQFWQFSDLLFAKALKSSPRINFQQSLWLLASKQGWNAQKLMQCELNKDYQKALSAFAQQAESLNLASTPSWFYVDLHTGKVTVGTGVLTGKQIDQLFSVAINSSE